MSNARRNRYLWRKYRITLKTWNKMFRAQRGRCAICLQKKSYRLHVDHDHKTERVRGLLCTFCNWRLLGRGRENPDHHERAATYLRSTVDWRKAA